MDTLAELSLLQALRVESKYIPSPGCHEVSILVEEANAEV